MTHEQAIYNQYPFCASRCANTHFCYCRVQLDALLTRGHKRVICDAPLSLQNERHALRACPTLQYHRCSGPAFRLIRMV